jgi:type VI secretion system ImpH/TssG family protein
MEIMENNIKIEKEIKQKPWEFSLHQALFILESLKKNKANFGCGKNPQDEPAFLSAYCNFSAPHSDCIKYQNENLTINHTSFIGPNGVLPQIYTEKILNKAKEKNNNFANFLNIFNQRQIGFLHKIEKNKKINLNFDHDKRNFANYISGVKGKSEAEKILKKFAGLLWQKEKNAGNLEAILHSVFSFEKFGITFKIDQFMGKWIDISHKNRAFLNFEPLKFKVLGKKAFCKHIGIKLNMTFQNLKIYNEFIPGSQKRKLIEAICKYYLQPGMQCKIQQTLVNESEKNSFMNKTTQLGFNCWIKSGKNLN